MKEDVIKVIVVDFREHGMKEPSYGVREIKNSLECLQGIVGGLIEIPPISSELNKRNIDMVINEEGKLLGLKTSALLIEKETEEVLDVIKGNIIFTSHDEEGNTISLNEEQIKYLEGYLSENFVFFRDVDDVGVAYLIHS